MKRCAACKQEFPLGGFGRDRHRPDGLNVYCLTCCREKARAIAARKRRPKTWQIVLATGRKRCAGCGEMLPVAQFHRSQTQRDGYRSHCKPCNIAQVRAYVLSNRDAVSSRRQASYRERIGEMKARDKARRERDGEKRRAAKNAANAANPEPNRRRGRQWYRANREKALAAALEWQRNNPRLAKERNDRRRARKMNAPVVENVSRAAIIERDRSTCGICGLFVDAKDIHLDHIVPLSQGGAHTEANLRVTHSRCNLSRKRTGYTEQLRLSV